MPIFFNEVDAREVNPPRDLVLAELWAAIQEHQAEIDRLERKYKYREQAIRQESGVVAETRDKIHARELAQRQAEQQRNQDRAAANIAAANAQQAAQETTRQELERITGVKF